MAEGPSIVILRERAAVFVGREIVRVEGDTPIAKERLLGERIVGVRSFGKHFLVELGAFTLRVHLLMLGSYCIDERKDKPIRLGLGVADGREINFYSCSVKFIEEPLDAVYDWRADVMSDSWDGVLARRKLRAMPEALVCDALLDQAIFAGVGNVIKNEILFRIRVHPLSKVGALPPARLRELVEQAREYTFEFYRWKKADVEGSGPVWQGDTLSGHWQVHNKKTCPRGHGRPGQGPSGRTRPAQLLLRAVSEAPRVSMLAGARAGEGAASARIALCLRAERTPAEPSAPPAEHASEDLRHRSSAPHVREARQGHGRTRPRGLGAAPPVP